MDPDLNKYDLNNRVTHHRVMSDEDWDSAYRAAWESFYSFEHMRTILRRAAAHPQGRPHTTLTTLLWFKLMTMFEAVTRSKVGPFAASHGATGAMACHWRAVSYSTRVLPANSLERLGGIGRCTERHGRS